MFLIFPDKPDVDKGEDKSNDKTVQRTKGNNTPNTYINCSYILLFHYLCSGGSFCRVSAGSQKLLKSYKLIQ